MSAQRATTLYENILEPYYSVRQAEEFAREIRSLISGKKTTWAELYFTEDEVTEGVRQANIASAKRAYGEMLFSGHSESSARQLASSIFSLVRDGIATWDELGFSEKDVRERLKRHLT